jgi:hypothetical protein
MIMRMLILLLDRGYVLIRPLGMLLMKNPLVELLTKLLDLLLNKLSNVVVQVVPVQAVLLLRNVLLTLLAKLFGLPDQDWNAIGWQAANNNWDVEKIRDVLADQITADTARNPGYVNDMISKTRGYAADYFVRVSEEEALQFAKQVASGELDVDSIKGEMARRAKSQYSWLSNAIDSGATLKEYFDPHRKTIADMMEISPDKVDFLNDPQWANVINRPPDADDQTRREMTLSEVQTFVRSKDQWSTTQNARSTAANGAVAIAKALGAL